jgi:hypothetical protein
MKRGDALKGKVKRARWRLRKALSEPATTLARRRQARRTVAFWEARLARFRKVQAVERASNRLWGGSRAVTNEIIRIVDGRAPVTSRKRTATFGNPGSDHHVSQRTADAVDFGIAEAYSLARDIAARLGVAGGWTGDYDSLTIERNGRSYRVQMIAGTHGTGPHLHCGVRRA